MFLDSNENSGVNWLLIVEFYPYSYEYKILSPISLLRFRYTSDKFTDK